MNIWIDRYNHHLCLLAFKNTHAYLSSAFKVTFKFEDEEEYSQELIHFLTAISLFNLPLYGKQDMVKEEREIFTFFDGFIFSMSTPI